MTQRNNLIFRGLQIIAWIIFVGLSIEAGALIVNFIYSWFKPEVVSHLYQKLDMSQMYQRSRWAYFSMYSFILAISILKALLFYVVVLLVTKLDLTKPFSSDVADKITTISYLTFATGIISYVARQSAQNLAHRGYEIAPLEPFWADSQAFLLMAAVIYVIAVIFRNGVELQNENNLTI